MKHYRCAYSTVFRKNWMLVMIIVALLFFTYSFWLWLPAIIIGDICYKLNIPYPIQNTIILLTVSTLFSLYFSPFNYYVAQQLQEAKHQTMLQLFCKIQLVSIVLMVIVFYLFFKAVLSIHRTGLFH